MSLVYSFASRNLARRILASRIPPVQCRTIFTGSSDRSKLGTAPAPYKSGMLPSVHWTIERVLATAMLPLYPIALYVDGPVMNFIVVTAVTMHSYWGFDGVIKDYAFERRYGPALMPILRTIWKVFAAAGFAGLLYFNYNDVGFITGVKKLWAM
ncbi:CybS [Opisthorchis viverrini]|uniref:Succinate dehydrogenase [ubiquinone] cytochrome b small subunit n=2 Tax=Opisthorchis viverrini TaxID=6198 RepID=A0A074Z432_OPIVI|nr:hypothetical protein T265_09911 [Opisthorchis viverrini]KER21846.1 hypothetical protein T265_09911 [Opisthorchis viverrini]OON13810.1 CybS [Opisthorchis viverrini]